jgi:AraC family transcriptional regulator
MERSDTGGDTPARGAGNFLDIIPENAGPRLTTFLGGVALLVRPPGSQAFLANDHCLGIMLAPSPGIRAAFGSDKHHEFDAPRGMLVVSPAGWDSKQDWSSTRENAVIALRPGSFRDLAAEEFDIGNVELQPPPFGTVDAVALHVAELLQIEMARGEAPDALYADSLLTVLSIHLLRNYTGADISQRRTKGGLSARSARRLEEFLDENFSRKLSVAELAAIAGLSRGHFISAFTRTFGQRPHQYVINRRLAFAEQLLANGGMSIAKVAYLSGFSSQSHMTTIMRKFRQVTPAQLQNQATVLQVRRNRGRLS